MPDPPEVSHPDVSNVGWSPAATWSRAGAAAVDVWRIDLAAEDLDGERWLQPAERERAARLLHQHRRRQFVRARTALRHLLARYLDADPASLVLTYGEHGRPACASDRISFNLSHSGDLALLAVAAGDLPLGVDVEELSDRRPLRRLAERFFSPAEAARLRPLDPEELVAAFYRGWTRKEAYVKAWGTGLSFSSRRFTLGLDPGSGRLLESTEMPNDDAAAWWFEDLHPAPGYVGAICWRGEEQRVRTFVHG